MTAPQAIAEGDLTADVRPKSERDLLGNSFAQMRTAQQAAASKIGDAIGG